METADRRPAMIQRSQVAPPVALNVSVAAARNTEATTVTTQTPSGSFGRTDDSGSIRMASRTATNGTAPGSPAHAEIQRVASRINVRDVGRQATMLKSTLKSELFPIVTPFKHWVWREYLEDAGVLNQFADIPLGKWNISSCRAEVNEDNRHRTRFLYGPRKLQTQEILYSSESLHRPSTP